MKANIKKMWVKALLSEKYEQTKGTLHEVTSGKDRFCCLGVLCDLAVKAGVEVDVETIGPVMSKQLGTIQYEIRYDSQSGYLPETVKVWAGLESDNGALPNGRGAKYSSLASYNDAGFSFKRITGLIEKWL